MKATYIDHMGTDLSVVNAARVSFGKKSEWETYYETPAYHEYPKYRLKPEDKGLINFLARGCTSGEWDKIVDELDELFIYDFETGELPNREDITHLLNHIRLMPPHWTPFGHTAITLHLKAPIFVARQVMKHQTGFVVNEVSRRYVTDEPEFYEPEVWRKAADNVKQGSSDETVVSIPLVGGPLETHPNLAYDRWLEASQGMYDDLLQGGVCPEQARMVLPQSMYTEWYMTGNLYGWANMFNQRTDPHTQKETRDLAHQIGEIIQPLYPVSWEALTR